VWNALDDGALKIVATVVYDCSHDPERSNKCTLEIWHVDGPLHPPEIHYETAGRC